MCEFLMNISGIFPTVADSQRKGPGDPRCTGCGEEGDQAGEIRRGSAT